MYNSKELGDLSDRELLAEARAYEAFLTSSAASLNFTNAQIQSIKDKNDAFEAKLNAWDAAQMAEDGALEEKNDARQETLTELREQRNAAYADAKVTDGALASAGMPPRDTTRTPSPAPSTAPFGYVDYGKLKHIIHFRDSATPDSRAKPKGMRGCEIWHYIGTAAPASEKDFDYLATDTNTPYTANYTMDDANKKVWYLLRWVSNAGEQGEWSDTLEATIYG